MKNIYFEPFEHRKFAKQNLISKAAQKHYDIKAKAAQTSIRRYHDATCD